MKRVFSLLLLIISLSANSQNNNKGKLIIEKFLASSIQSNHGGEDPVRQITVYLPAGYDESRQRYPVIYFLHGFTGSDSSYMAGYHLKDLLDSAIGSGKIRPVIFVLPNTYTTFKGSFYTNSTLTGNWSDFIAKDVVEYIDKKYRTIPNRNNRGLCGHSMGGNGAIKIGMLHSNVFGAVYALSPARLNWGAWLTYGSDVYKRVQAAKSVNDFTNDFPALEIADLARTYSPNENKPPLYIDLPYSFDGDSVIVNTDALQKWDRNFPVNMIAEHIADLKSLNALKLDWGRNDNFPFIPIACLEFSKKLELYGIDHYAEEYIGDHRDKLGGMDGRIYTELLPFFDTYLWFREK